MNHTKELIERAHRGDEKARETLVLENMGLIGSIVRRFAGSINLATVSRQVYKVW